MTASEREPGPDGGRRVKPRASAAAEARAARLRSQFRLSRFLAAVREAVARRT